MQMKLEIDRLIRMFNTVVSDYYYNDCDVLNYGQLLGIRSAYYMLFGEDENYNYMSERIKETYTRSKEN